MITLVEREPPKSPPLVALAYADYIRDLGDRIAALKPSEAQELFDYLKIEGVS